MFRSVKLQQNVTLSVWSNRLTLHLHFPVHYGIFTSILLQFAYREQQHENTAWGKHIVATMLSVN